MPLPLSIVLEVLATAIKEGKEVNRIQTGKEELKLSLFADDMILSIELKDATIILLGFINENGKVVSYKVNTQKLVAFLYTNNERS